MVKKVIPGESSGPDGSDYVWQRGVEMPIFFALEISVFLDMDYI